MPRKLQKPELSPKQRRFVSEYAKDSNGTQAAIRAGYAVTSADVTAARLLGNERVKAAVQAAVKRTLDAAESDAERVVRELQYVGLSDVGQMFDSAGQLLALKDMPEAARRSISSIEVEEVPGIDRVLDDGTVKGKPAIRVSKIKLWPKTTALDLLARKHGLLVEKVQIEHTGKLEHILTVAQVLRKARAGR